MAYAGVVTPSPVNEPSSLLIRNERLPNCLRIVCSTLFANMEAFLDESLTTNSGSATTWLPNPTCWLPIAGCSTEIRATCRPRRQSHCLRSPLWRKHNPICNTMCIEPRMFKSLPSRFEASSDPYSLPLLDFRATIWLD